MVGIQGLGGVPEPKSERVDRARNERENQAREAATKNGAAAQDDVSISNEAQAAAEANRIVQLAKNDSDIRAERVAAARERIERGDYKNPEIVAQVAQRISKYLP